MHRWLSHRVPSWSHIGGIVEHRIWNIAFVFFVVMPIAAHALRHFPSSLEVHIGNTSAILEFGLPFSWWALYFSALFISLAKALHFLVSPRFIRQYPDYEDFKRSGRGGGYLQKTLFELIPFWKKSAKNSLNTYVSEFDQNVHFLNSDGIRNVLQSDIWAATDQSFWLVHDIANHSKTYARLVCVAAISLAALLFIVVVVQKVGTVIALLSGVI